MEWSKTKTIFILAFLILDLYLAFVFFETRNNPEFKVMKDVSKTTEEILEAKGITYDELPSEEKTGFYISAKSREFTVAEISKLQGQTIFGNSISNSSSSTKSFTKLSMQLDEPFPIPDVNITSKVEQFLKEKVLYGDLYEYWFTDKEEGAIICIQQYKANKIFQSNDSDIAMVKLFLNEENEIYYYEQSMLEDIKEVREKEVTVSALEAIGALNNMDYLPANSKIINTEYGYYTNIPLTNQQILAPTWHITIETEEGKREDFYVNALEVDVIQTTEKDTEE